MKKLVNVFLLNLCLCLSVAYGQDVKIAGKVTDGENAVLPDVNILVSGSSLGTVTDADGKYAINASASGSLVFSFISYESQAVAINGRSSIDVKLVQELKTLNEVVVVGYAKEDRCYRGFVGNFYERICTAAG